MNRTQSSFRHPARHLRRGLIQVTIAVAIAATVATLTLAADAADRDLMAWKAGTPDQPTAVLVRNATIWTSGPDGLLENADLLVRNGKIAAIGPNLSVPRGALTIDAEGKHVSPGLIDAHSHVAIRGGVNEGSNIVTAEVRIADVLNPDDVSLYRQLAGGLTSANVLHGSANAIGGQNAIIKLRWGANAEDLLIESAPQGVKFALGENVKQSNWNPDTPRYPQTRPGVEQILRENFLAALDYRLEWKAYKKKVANKESGAIPPRRNLQTEALVEILEGERDVHAHSYRADEIIMLMRVAEEMGFRVKCFQHVLEGYKVADEIAAHGATASTFADWWAYKYEVFDAIPYNGAILLDRGVVTSFNSDSNELARRMNLEAAKAVRFGKVEPTKALQLVTSMPAEQLGIGDRTGSLEVGKDADFVVWSGSPLSTYSIAEQTWIDGRKYFDRAEDLTAREEWAAERQELIAAIRASQEAEEAEEEEAEEGEGGEGDAQDAESTDPTDPTDPTSEDPNTTPEQASSLASFFAAAEGVNQ